MQQRILKNLSGVETSGYKPEKQAYDQMPKSLQQ